MENLILVKVFNKKNEVLYTYMVEDLFTAQSGLAADLDGWDEEADYGTAELLVYLNVRQY
jgi:hypothetical protein